MKIGVNGKVIPTAQVDKWKVRRIPKVLRTLKQKSFSVANVEDAMKRLTDAKLRLSYHYVLAGTGGRPLHLRERNLGTA